MVLSGRQIYSYRSMGVTRKSYWCFSTWSAPLELKLCFWIIILPLSDMLFLWRTPLYIWWGCLQPWGGCDSGHILGEIIHNNPKICYIFPYVFSYIGVGHKHFFSVTSTFPTIPWDILPILFEKYLIQTGNGFRFLWDLCTPRQPLCTHQWLHWSFFSCSHAVLLICCCL